MTENIGSRGTKILKNDNIPVVYVCNICVFFLRFYVFDID
jgi:hypothetical protein